MNYCPFKATNLTGESASFLCWGNKCELWNEHFGRCSLAVDAYLKGQEDRFREKGMEQKDRRS